MEKKLVIAHDLEENLVKAAEEAAPGWTVITGKDEDQWGPRLKDATVIAGWKKAMTPYLDQAENLEWIQSWSAGIDSHPLEAFEKHNIKLTSANGVHAFPIAETIFAMMLGWTRHIHTYTRQQQEKKWHHAGLKLELHGKKLALLGAGAIGKETAKIAKAFGMEVAGFRRSGEKEEYFDEMYQLDQLHQVLPDCDYIVITLPLTKETNGLFTAETFEQMKPESFLVNIGRGEIIDEKAMVQALKEGEIAGAGLDVFATEPLPEDSPLWEMDNVIVTPHTAGSTEYYNARVIRDILIPNLKSFINDEKLSVNVVDYQKGY
ncbi:D-2-hydroxyacid dehydrogenase [Jeotgalibacillus haloalkalitolerans]|uniref:D-2-hydroxyacid dehydrogenase n=1 Tax=Jeotgalibacillus haloalkalitolerans TaxID=3104292 RepID=A0ABU5KPZ6_9BACL|nr:D-2-hydroxyacid dehydrogenase [Jeotgalibacillus sp. HH7-29]MDZ5713316.1 D-2-hydroxyacid dehydrogenase [Jeotgalibacillus sp. HH7-29]